MEKKDIHSEIEKTLNSLDNLQKAGANPFLYEKVMSRLDQKEAKVVSMNPRLVWRAAACFAALLVLNVFVFTQSEDTTPADTGATAAQTEESNPVAQEYFSYLSNTQF